MRYFLIALALVVGGCSETSKQEGDAKPQREHLCPDMDRCQPK